MWRSLWQRICQAVLAMTRLSRDSTLVEAWSVGAERAAASVTGAARTPGLVVPPKDRFFAEGILFTLCSVGRKPLGLFGS